MSLTLTRWTAVAAACVLSVAVGATFASRARAQGHDDDAAATDLRAQASFRAATAYYDAGDYENALRDFQTSYDLSRRPELLWNLYLCHERLAQWEQAAGALESFLQAGAPGYEAAQVEARLANLRHRIARRQGGESDAQIAQEEPDPDPARTDTPPSPTDTTPYVAIVGFSVAAVGLVAFGIFGGLTLAEDAALANECADHCTASRAATLDTYALVADISAATALVGAIVGVIGIFVAPSAPTPSSGAALRLTPWGGLAGVGLTLEGSL